MSGARLGIVKRALAKEPVRFLLVGATNTALGFLLYSGLWLFVGKYIGYLGALYGSYVVAIFVAFYLYRRFVFRSTGRRVLEFLRFSSVYVVSLAVNSIALPLLVEFGHVPAIPAQAIVVAITTVCSYVGHKYFSFGRKRSKA